MDIGDEDEKARELLATLDDAKLGCLLDGVDRVAGSVRKADDFGLGRLRLEQEGGEILSGERMAYLAKDLTATLDDDRFRVALEGVAEGIVGGQEEPGVTPLFDERIARAVGQGPGVVDPMHGVG